MKTDTLFYQLFQSFPSIFFELIKSSPETANFYQFSSVEVKQLAFRIDGVFLPSVIEQPIYFVEVQFQGDTNFYSRFFTEIFLYLNKTDLTNDWRGVIIYPQRGIDTGETKRYEELLHSGRVVRIYLNELENVPPPSVGLATIQLVVTDKNQAIKQGKDLIKRVRREFEDDRGQQELLKLIETILIYKLPQANRKEIEAMFSLSDLKQTRVYQEALEEGREQGLEQGLEQGRIQGKLESVPALLALGLSVQQIAEVLGLEIDQVRQTIPQQHN